MSNCGACRFFATVDANDSPQQVGVCQRYPPVVIYVPQVTAGLDGKNHVGVSVKGSAWPQLFASGSCGEWQRREGTPAPAGALVLNH
jgi:hypothetical protein